MIPSAGLKIRWTSAALCVALLGFVQVGFGQVPAGPPGQPPDSQQAAPLLRPEQLDNLVAPVALYPDPLLGQVLAASTYPLEIVEAQRWLQQNRGLQGSQLVDAARQQNWDPSVVALVAFPDVMNLLNNDIRWTTDLGNAFLSQQADVMAAVQTMRARARANGKLQTTPQEVVTTDTQAGQSSIEIQPANPQVIYVPVYQPQYVYGAALWGAYPDLWYPPAYGLGFGFGWGPGIYIGSFFPGWGGWGGWGWGLGWGGGGLFVNAGFFNRYGFGGRYGYGYGHGYGALAGGRALWAHDPGHRMGVPYSNRAVASRYNSSRFASGSMNGSRLSGANRNAYASPNRGSVGGTNGGWRQFGSNNRTAANGSSNRQASPNYGGRSGYGAGGQTYRGSNSAPSYGRSSGAYAAPRAQNYSAPRSYSAPRGQSYSAPRGQSYSAPRGQSNSAPRSFGGGSSSGGHSFSGGGGGHSGGGGGHSGGGGRHR